MSDNTTLNPGSGGDIAAADDIEGVKYQRVKLTLGADGVNDGDVSSANPVPISGTVALDAASLAALENISVTANFPATQTVEGAVSVSNFPAQTALTDAQLRATALPVSGTFYQATQPVSAAALPLPTGAATDATVVALQELNDTMVCLLSAMLEKMPRVTGNDQCAVSIESGTVSLPSTTDIRNITGAITGITNMGGKHISGVADALTMSGTTHIYSNIAVS